MQENRDLALFFCKINPGFYIQYLTVRKGNLLSFFGVHIRVKRQLNPNYAIENSKGYSKTLA